MKTTHIFSHLLLFSANLIYALNYTVAKDVMPSYIEPAGFILMRVIGAVFLFAACHFIFIKESVQRKDIFLLAVCGLFGVAINQLFFFEGLNLTTPINASIVMTSNPIWVLLLSFLILKESLNMKKVIGFFSGIIGASILILDGNSLEISSNYQIGNVLVLINAFSYALYLVLVKRLMKKYHPITIMFYVFFFGFFYVLPFGYKELNQVEWNIIPINIFYAIGFVVIFTTFFAYLFNSAGLKNLSPSTVSIYIYLQPLFATLFAIYREVDNIDSKKVIASFFIFIGVYLVSTYSSKQKTKKLS